MRPRRWVEEPPSTGTPFGLLSDLSANLFAALLLILLLLLQARLKADAAPPAPPAAVEATTALGARAHRPLPGRGLVALLKARTPDTSGLGLDLTDAGLTIASDSRFLPAGAAMAPALTQVLRAAPEGDVRLYVFDNRPYADVTATLTREGRSWIEISVPRALRDAGGRQAWSAAFLALLASPSSEAGFREGLARLLTRSAGPLRPEGHAAGAETPGGGGSFGDRAILSRWLQASILAAGILAMLAIEASTRPSGLWRARPGRSGTLR